MNFSNIAIVYFNRTQEPKNVPNLVKISRETVEESWRDKNKTKQKQTDRKIYFRYFCTSALYL